jgi:hypothetical protein
MGRKSKAKNPMHTVSKIKKNLSISSIWAGSAKVCISY